MSSSRQAPPTREQLAAAEGRRVADVVGPDLRVLFCGINPGLWSAAVGHHFAHPSNRFWKVLAEAGFTDRRLRPDEEQELLARGLGVTNLVDRATRAASDLRAAELRSGTRTLEEKVRRFRPAFVAVVGIGAYRLGFRRPRAGLGAQADSLAESGLWVLPNPSGAQASYGQPALVEAYRRLRLEVPL